MIPTPMEIDYWRTRTIAEAQAQGYSHLRDVCSGCGSSWALLRSSFRCRKKPAGNLWRSAIAGLPWYGKSEAMMAAEGRDIERMEETVMATLICFVAFAAIPEEKITENITRRVLAGEKAMMVWWSIKAGVHAAAHSHPHEQIVWLLNGKMEFRIGDERRVMNRGDVAVIPGGVEHEGWCREDTEVVDVFAPPREDFLAGGTPTYMREKGKVGWQSRHGISGLTAPMEIDSYWRIRTIAEAQAQGYSHLRATCSGRGRIPDLPLPLLLRRAGISRETFLVNVPLLCQRGGTRRR